MGSSTNLTEYGLVVFLVVASVDMFILFAVVTAILPAIMHCA